MLVLKSFSKKLKLVVGSKPTLACKLAELILSRVNFKAIDGVKPGISPSGKRKLVSDIRIRPKSLSPLKSPE